MSDVSKILFVPRFLGKIKRNTNKIKYIFDIALVYTVLINVRNFFDITAYSVSDILFLILLSYLTEPLIQYRSTYLIFTGCISSECLSLCCI